MKAISHALENYVFNWQAFRELAALIIAGCTTYVVYQSTSTSPDANFLSSMLSKALENTTLYVMLSLHGACCLLVFSYASIRSLLTSLALLVLSMTLNSLGFAYEAKVSISLALVSILLFSARTLDHYSENKLRAKRESFTGEPERI